MTSEIRPPAVRPRTAGQPEADLTTFAIIHRAMRGEARRLAALTAEQGDLPFPAEREAALQRHLDHLLHEIHSHHAREDAIVWPVLVASAGAAIDLGPLTEDHAAIDPCLDRIRATRGVARATALADLRDLLDEHITEEEASVFPVLRRYVSKDDWDRCEKEIAKGPFGQMKWVVPLIAAYSTPPELAHLLKEAGPVMRLILRLTRPSFTRLSRAVYGA
ncbi:hemerythrin HHE cation binding domain-containing protein [Actinocorallia herbida]|uniref:Hemerythrin HHE cation binding domain-containing protein n=1 Tax=Actinocorallia herbida TaxID=58109 RepID=A0A3N1CQS5_9ACTN|nr:hemerythrin domain-containing protein [Actinocorallia herbida]ROO83653.1 hemerythrin HHE cation binding domain-containing protein [Actinocorallia herbida]